MKGSVLSVTILKWCKGILPSPWLCKMMVPKADAASAPSHGVTGASQAPDCSLIAWAAALPALAKLRSQSSQTKITKSQLSTSSPSGLCKGLGRGLWGIVKCELYIKVKFSTKKWVHRAALNSQASFLRHWFSRTHGGLVYAVGIAGLLVCELASLEPADLHFTSGVPSLHLEGIKEYRAQGLPKWWHWGFKNSC